MSEWPKVWRAFERRAGASLCKFEVRDIPEAMWAEAVEFMLGSYIREDVWWKTADTASDPEAIQEYRVLLTGIIQLKLSIGCFLLDQEGDRLVAVNMCMPQARDQFVKHAPPKTSAGLLSLRMFAEAMKVSAIYDKFRVSEYLMGAGLSVAEDKRNLGIARELLKSRVDLARSHGFQATGGVFTSRGAQRAAAAAAWCCCHSVSYKDFGDACGIAFNTDTESLMMFGASAS